MTKAAAPLSLSMRRRSGIVTLSTSAWLSMPYGPSAKVVQTISGPFAKASGRSASSMPRVTVSFEFGLITTMRRRVMRGLLGAIETGPRTLSSGQRIAVGAMTEQSYDIVIRGGTVATASASFEADLSITGETIAGIGLGLPAGRREIDARGKLVLPGGVDSHCHIEQLSAAGIMNADSWESATTSAAFGGTTTVISFAAQHVGMNLARVVEEYAGLARRGAVVDYSFHMIVADPTEATLKEHLPALIRQGHASIKVFMTYDRLRVQDEHLLDVLLTARENRALVCVHAENHGMIAWMGKRLVERGYTAPKFHAMSHPRVSEAEAFNRLNAMAALVDQPIMIFHVSTAEGAATVRRARGEGLKVFAETCPQYLFLSAHDLDKPGLDGAKWMCSPPPRTAEDQEALWRALALGDLQTISSDHAPYAFDETGKLRAGPNANFKQVANRSEEH